MYALYPIHDWTIHWNWFSFWTDFFKNELDSLRYFKVEVLHVNILQPGGYVEKISYNGDRFYFLCVPMRIVCLWVFERHAHWRESIFTFSWICMYTFFFIKYLFFDLFNLNFIWKLNYSKKLDRNILPLCQLQKTFSSSILYIQNGLFI